ncbi:MAG: alanine racemase [Candidatus Omnitrophota bacterium]
MSRPTWAEIDLDAIADNYRSIKERVGEGAGVLAVVKANAYGFGIIEVARSLLSEGVPYLGVACVDEAVILREAGVKSPILILSSILPEEIKEAVRHNLTLTLCEKGLSLCVDKAARALNKRVLAHLKVDTGMGRLGIWHDKAESLIEYVSDLKNVSLEGIFTHFSSADEECAQYTFRQISDFKQLLEDVRLKGIEVRYVHAANSAGTILYKDSHFNMVRPGLMLYGLYPNDTTAKAIKLKPAMSLKTRIIFLKQTPAGRNISYGRSYTTERETLIATLPIGYADGLNRHLSNRGWVIIRGKRCPIVGRICMDHTMIDVGHLDKVSVGDEAVLIGSQADERITVEEIAHLLNTIPYEVVCWISSRVPRVYKQNAGF